jgi:hypothetical protein
MEAGDVADLGHEQRVQDRPDAGDLLDRDITGIAGQTAPDDPGEQIDLEVQVLDHPVQRGDPGRGDRTEPGIARRSCERLPR